jgi:hypothetical protein
MHARQNGMRLPVSSILAQIRHGAGNNNEASASHMPRHGERAEAGSLSTMRQAYSCYAII